MVTLLVAMEDSLLVATGDDGDWRAERRSIGTSERIECVAAAPSKPGRIFCGTLGGGLRRSEDGGETWVRIAADAVESAAVTSVAVSPRDPDEVWVGTEPSAVYRSLDGGDTWWRRGEPTDLPSASGWSFPPRPHTHHVRWIEVDPAAPDHLYVSIEAGALIQTRDAGETWVDRVPSSRRDNHSLATHPEAPGRAYAAAGDGYAETRDAGETWVHPQEGLDHRYVWSVAVDPGDPDTRLVSAARGPQSAHSAGSAESYVYRRTGDDPWERVAGLPSGEGVLRPVLAAGHAPMELYAASNRGLFRTGDAGGEWTRLDVSWPAAFERQAVRGLVTLP
ncbi:MAG: WD40/YVTN/BNR-like repeat-containing protein [Salinigranum sp.]